MKSTSDAHLLLASYVVGTNAAYCISLQINSMSVEHGIGVLLLVRSLFRVSLARVVVCCRYDPSVLLAIAEEIIVLEAFQIKAIPICCVKPFHSFESSCLFQYCHTLKS